MKRIKIVEIVSIILIVTVVFCSCGVLPTQGSEDKDPSDTEDKIYSSIIALLESEIKLLKEEQAKSASEYEKRVEELEKKIFELTQESTTAEPPSEDNEEPSPFTYKLDGENAVITSYSGKYSVLVIPEKIDGYTVTAIDDCVFQGNTSLTVVSLPSGLTHIGWMAFSGCTSLTSATVPESVGSIGYDAFAHCNRLTLYCSSGSYAEKYAQSFAITCIAN